MPVKYKTIMTSEQEAFIDKVKKYASTKAISIVLEVSYNAVRNYLNQSNKKDGFKKGRGAINTLNIHNLREMLKNGSENEMLSKFFVSRYRMPWSDSEKAFVEDTDGIKDRSEKAQLLGRSERSVWHIECEMGLDYAVNSGYWTINDVAQALNLSAGWGGMLRRHLSNKRLNPIEGSGHGKKTLDVPVSKLRYVVRDAVKNTKDVPAKSVRQFFRLTKFKKLLFDESEVDRFVRDIYPDRPLECILCSDKSKGSLYCSRCQDSALFPYTKDVAITKTPMIPTPHSGCCFQNQ